MKTDRQVLNKMAKACVALEVSGYIIPRDEAAKTLAYTLCRVVLLGMNDLDQSAPGSARTTKSQMTLSDNLIKSRLKREFSNLMNLLE